MNDFSEKGADRKYELPAWNNYLPVQACLRQVQTTFSRMKIVLTEKLLK